MRQRGRRLNLNMSENKNKKTCHTVVDTKGQCSHIRPGEVTSGYKGCVVGKLKHLNAQIVCSVEVKKKLYSLLYPTLRRFSVISGGSVYFYKYQ